MHRTYKRGINIIQEAKYQRRDLVVLWLDLTKAKDYFYLYKIHFTVGDHTTDWQRIKKGHDSDSENRDQRQMESERPYPCIRLGQDVVQTSKVPSLVMEKDEVENLFHFKVEGQVTPTVMAWVDLDITKISSFIY